MKTFLRLSAFLLWLVWAAGCAVPPADSAPTLIPTEQLPTIIAQTVEAAFANATAVARAATENAPQAAQPTPEPSPTLEPSATPVLTLPPAAPSPTPAPSATPTQQVAANPGIPKMQIEINTPGQLSRVASPIVLRTWLVPGQDGKVYLELIGEDGRLLYRKIQGVAGLPGRKVELDLDIEFEIPGVSELARLLVYTKDAFNRVTAMNSVDLVLLSSGKSDPNTGGDQLERVVVQFPPPDASIQGGSLVVQGIARPQYGPFIVVELITETGAIAGWRLITVSDGPLDQFRSFSAEISYNVSAPTRVLLVVRESTERIKGVTYLTSQPLLLRP